MAVYTTVVALPSLRIEVSRRSDATHILETMVKQHPTGSDLGNGEMAELKLLNASQVLIPMRKTDI